MVRYSILPALFLFFNAFAIIVPSGAFAQEFRVWTTQYVSARNCRAYRAKTGPETFGKSVQGFSWPMPKGSAAEFIDRTVRHLNAAASGVANDKLLLQRLLAAANSNAFTKLDFGAAGGSSPSFVSSVMVRTVSFSVSYLKSRNAISKTDLETVDIWVRKLLKNSNSRASSADHKASIAASTLIWGAASGNKKLFKSGISKLNSVLGKIRNNPRFDSKVRVNNEILPHVLMAAQVLRLNGIDVFSKKFGKYNLHDVVANHAAWVLQTGAAKVSTSASADKVARAIMKSDGWGTHQAWIPLYLALYPKSEASAVVRQLHAKVKKAQNTAYYGRNMGIQSACYFGL